MSTEFLESLFNGGGITMDEYTDKKRNEVNEMQESLVADSDDQDLLTPEELVSEEVVEDEVEESTDEAQPDEDNEEVVEESEEEEGESEDTDEVETNKEEDLYVDLKDGTQISLSEIVELKKNGLMQADYTKKTTELANERKDFEKEKQNNTSQKLKNEELGATLELLINEAKEDVDLEYLEEYDPGEYLKQIRITEKRDKALKDLKENKNSLKAEKLQTTVNEEASLLLNAVPEWKGKNDQVSESFGKEWKEMNDYLINDIGMSDSDIGSIVNHKQWLVIRQAYKNSVNVNKKEAMSKKIKMAPTVTKSHKKVDTKSVINKEISEAESRLKKNGTLENLNNLKRIRMKYAK